jgi:hypothetical protein
MKMVGSMQLVPVVGMNSSSFKCSNSMFYKSWFIQGVSVDINLSKSTEMEKAG